MFISDFKNCSEPCFRDDPPPCAAACTLGVDVRALIDKVQRKNFTAAYRLYRNHVLFPAIVSRICHQPCLETCVRGRADRSVNLKAIEAAAVAYTKEDRAVAFNVPPKPFTVAVVGAGLSGLACVLKLASRNYRVNIYDQVDHLGGRLWEVLPPEIIQAELEKQFYGLDFQFFPNHRVTDLTQLEADAVYVATGCDGAEFGLLDGLNRQSLGSGPPGVFLGGGLLGADGLQAIENGIRASYSIEKYLKVGGMDGVEDSYLKAKINEKFYLLPLNPPAGNPGLGGDNLSPEEAQAESGRCQRCNCEMCRTGCAMMRAFKTVPAKMTTDVIASVGSKESITNRVGMKMINACAQCGLCRRVCPESVDMEMCLLDARRQMHKELVMPPAYHDFWLRDMFFSNQEGYLTCRPKGRMESSMVFFPGCQLGASDPDYVLKTHEYLTGIFPDLSLILSCCGVPADWAGNEESRDAALARIRKDWERLGQPTFIVACPTCLKTFGRYFPEATTVSLYEILAKNPPPRAESTEIPGLVSIFDPCASRDYSAMRAGVRQLVQAWGGVVTELDHRGELAQCCGFGGQIQAVRPSLFDEIVADRVSQADHEYICYCTNCRDIFAVSGKASRHILDLFFTGNPADRRPPSLGQRRKNRLALKQFFSEINDPGPTGAGPEQPKAPSQNNCDNSWRCCSTFSRQQSGKKVERLASTCHSYFVTGPKEMKMLISDELLTKMDRLLILEEEVREVLAHCESGQKLRNSKTGLFSGHLKIGFITYWVTYAKEDDEVRLVNVYSHRMTITDDQG